MLLARDSPGGGLQEGRVHMHQPVIAALLNGFTKSIEALWQAAPDLDMRLPPCIQYLQVDLFSGSVWEGA